MGLESLFFGAFILLVALIYGTLNWAFPRSATNGREPEFSEEDLQREELGPRGVGQGKSSEDDATAGKKDAEGC